MKRELRRGADAGTHLAIFKLLVTIEMISRVQLRRAGQLRKKQVQPERGEELQERLQAGEFK